MNEDYVSQYSNYPSAIRFPPINPRFISRQALEKNITNKRIPIRINPFKSLFDPETGDVYLIENPEASNQVPII